ncbi:MFS transporter [Archangium gephyra]|uniref:Drug resistance transporter, EmrB/QacA family n=1 Tax=Archangium gephyra TaxID=48 RepID=A0AAC8Q0P5_9BACT|nr:MFS transporter [Archangium gephyra]AKI98879.1 drug resistance transporter, EmrB/QacA family [Archangium gephyra]REG30796.1 MFS transporter [Archangium gephyra]
MDVSSELQPAALPGSARRMATSAVLLGLVVSAFETTVVTSAMPTLTRELGGQHLYSWVFSSYLFASTLGILLFGKLADHLGRKPVFSAGMGLFLLGSVLCGFSQSVPALIAFRLVQGLGAGALQPTTMTISADLYTLRERAAVQGLFTGAWGAATVVGPLIGGWLVTYASWRWVFLVNVPVGLLALALLHASYRDPARSSSSRVEVRGPALTGVSLGLLLFALERGGSSALRLSLALAACVGLAAVVRQQRSSPSPLVPLALLRDRTVLCGVLGGVLGGALLYTTTALVPLWMTGREGHTPLMAGLALVPLLGGWACGSTFGVRVFLRGGLRASAGGGFALCLGGACLLALAVSRDWGTPAAFIGLGLMGLGLGPAASTSLLGPQTRAPWHHRGMVTSAIYATRMLGGSFTLAALELVPPGFPVRFALVASLAGAAALSLALFAPGRVVTEAGAPS